LHLQYGFGAVQVHQKSGHFVRQISRSFIGRLQFLSNRRGALLLLCKAAIRYLIEGGDA
jgi:hypothetical protein